mmetsp:Transcript_63298/g.131688  ORF Transcript_63298/g.131688 Transcript_63298/m.131688 type:complete len:92 (+) Transcript_63298:173-448(+)
MKCRGWTTCSLPSPLRAPAGNDGLDEKSIQHEFLADNTAQAACSRRTQLRASCFLGEISQGNTSSDVTHAGDMEPSRYQIVLFLRFDSCLE